jgi:hypothetical protein
MLMIVRILIAVVLGSAAHVALATDTTTCVTDLTTCSAKVLSDAYDICWKHRVTASCTQSRSISDKRPACSSNFMPSFETGYEQCPSIYQEAERRKALTRVPVSPVVSDKQKLDEMLGR